MREISDTARGRIELWDWGFLWLFTIDDMVHIGAPGWIYWLLLLSSLNYVDEIVRFVFTIAEWRAKPRPKPEQPTVRASKRLLFSPPPAPPCPFSD